VKIFCRETTLMRSQKLQKLTMFPQATAEKLAEQSSNGAFRIEELALVL